MKTLKVDLCVIGGGSGGLSVAAGAVQMGATVVLIEQAEMGGDCLNAGCVPSKALIASAKHAKAIESAKRFGVEASVSEVNYQAVHDHIHGVIEAIRPNDSEKRFKTLGVTVIKARAQFIDNKTVKAGQAEIKARRFVVATGSTASVPPIPGLDTVPYFTNQTIFSLKEKPIHLIIVGAGPIGCEIAQAHRRLGVRVSVLDMATMLPKDDPELVDVVRKRFVEEGVELHECVTIERVEQASESINVLIAAEGKQEVISGSHLLVAAGRKPNLDGLGLDKAKVKHDRPGIVVNARLQSVSNRRVFAVGDVAGRFQFTHAASYHAGIVIRNSLFAWPAKVDYRAMPWCTYTDPELAHVGLQENQAKRCRVLRFSFKDNDRAQAERETAGLIKVIVSPKGRVQGCSIVGHNAGELILPWILAVQQNMPISKLATVIAPYPTLSEISKRVAGSYYAERLFSSRTQRIVRWIQCVLP
ncbi:MAG: dihydrolipoamide dehydrogenase [Gammaproteobacteria bacterium CG11_big_fil_rev_8_21_14_0_20_46_22]|nr:MAG: dihydrolipoamide dehydrogenase [Gammaproteobacteria bacterium CG12_big_fil_rev_8_21_14_0_65_46_12]PIR10688.1 MAG: dihydrolipoamide dehydrogenase [Gammaproteobacteria bacterium CG11_big_fil_rev_8_21_14_0_20_46_22]